MPCDEPGYITEIAPDCNNNGDNDQFEIDRGDEFPMDEWPDLDIDNNGVIDGTCIGNCACDWDGNFDVAVPDIFAFLTDWFASRGPNCAS